MVKYYRVAHKRPARTVTKEKWLKHIIGNAQITYFINVYSLRVSNTLTAATLSQGHGFPVHDL